MPIDPLTIVMVVILAALVFFMFRNSRKRQKEQTEMRAKMVPGAEVMTNFGLYGTLVSVDEDDNTALIETSPGHVVKVHRQVLARVVEPGAAESASTAATVEESGIEQGRDSVIRDAAPEFGERLDDSVNKPGTKSDD